jgi:nicotinamide-nucleotide amidase
VIVEVITVGTELLIGQIVDTNAAFIGTRLAEAGFDAHFRVTVGDNLERLSDAIRTALGRADAVLLTGGMGPTRDDLTREAICAVIGRPMTRNAEHAARIRERIRARGGVATDTVLRMADHPEGAQPLPNSQGLALGVAAVSAGRQIVALPGVPREMRAMLQEEVIPLLRRAAGTAEVITSRVLHTWGYGESQVAELLDDLFASANPSLAFLITDMEVRVRLTAKGADAAATEALLAPAEQVVRRRLGPAVFARDEGSNLGVVASLLTSRGWRVAVHDVGTAGQAAARLAAGSPEVFAGGAILPLSEPASAAALARRAREAHGAAVGVGVGAPRVVEDAGQRASLIAIAVVTPEGEDTRELRFFGTGERARAYAVDAAHHLLRLAVAGDWWSWVQW